MNYKFNRVEINGEPFGVNAFEKLMNFVHSFNDAKKASGATDAEIIASLKSSGMQDAEAMYKTIRLISSGSIPSEREEQVFMSDYANYMHEKLAKNQQQIDELKEAYNNESRYVDENGKSYTASELKKEGQKAKKQVKKSKWARFGLIALVAIPLALVAGGLFTAVATWAVGAGLLSTSVISIASMIGLTAGAIAGGVLGKKWYDANGRQAKLKNNIALAKAYEQNKDYIAEQEHELQNALAMQHSLRNAFGIEVDANGNEIGNAYEDIYNKFNRADEQTTETQEPEHEVGEPEQTTEPKNQRFTPITSSEDIDEFINGAYDNSQQKFTPITTFEDIDEFVNSIYGPTEQEVEEEPEEVPSAPIVVAPIVNNATEELVREAEEYGKYINENMYDNGLAESAYGELRRSVKNSVETVKNADSKEAQEEAIAELKATYIETRHIVNNNKVAPIVAQTVGTDAEDYDYSRMVQAIESVKNEYEKPIAQGSYVDRLENDLMLVQKEEALAHILKTYTTLKQTKYIIENSQQLNITPEERTRELQELGAIEKYLHIVIENALQEETTLEDLNRIINDGYKEVSYLTWLDDFDKDVQKFFKEGTKYNPISYFGCVVELQKTRNLIEQRVKINKETNKEDEEAEIAELEAVAERTLSDGDINVEVSGDEQIATGLQDITIVEEDVEVEEESESEEEVVVNSDGAMKVHGLLSSGVGVVGLLPAGKQDKNFDASVADEIMRQEAEKRKQASRLKELANEAYLVEDLTEEELEKAREEISKLVRKNAKLCGAAGRYVLAVIENNGYKYVAASLNKAELRERKAEIKEAIVKTTAEYRKYVIVPITNKITKEKIEYYREINPNGENNGLKRGAKSDVSDVKIEGDKTYYSAMLNDYIADYLASYNKILKIIEEDKKARQVALKLAKTIVTTEISQALKNGENPIEAAEKIMNKAFKNLEDRAKNAALGVVDKSQDEM